MRVVECYFLDLSTGSHRHILAHCAEPVIGLIHPKTTPGNTYYVCQKHYDDLKMVYDEDEGYSEEAGWFERLTDAL